jgi:hypothetical protein
VLVHNIALVERLALLRRADHAPVLRAIAEIVTDRAPEALALAALDPGNPARRAALRFALARGGRAGALVRAEGINDDEPWVRLLALRALARDRAAGEALREAALELCVDPSAAVRREAIRHLGEGDRPVLEDALFDPSASVREVARSRLGPRDFAAVYRATLHSPDFRRFAAAVGGLGETGGREDAAAVAFFAAHPRPVIRRVAVRALARLDAAAHEALFLAALDDPCGSVGREAAAALSDRMHVVPEASVARLLVSGRLPVTRRRALDLLARLDRWTALAALLDALVVPDAELAERARLHLDRWAARANAGYVPPSAEALARVDTALGRAGPHLDSALCTRLDWAIAPWRKR